MLCVLLRTGYVMLGTDAYREQAIRIQERERSIKAPRGRILDRNGIVLADNRLVCTISVIPSQITEPEEVIQMLSRELGLTEEELRLRVEKNTSIERIKSNISKEIGDRIRAYGYAGVKVDEDYKRYYPYGTLASKVLGFTGGDNQGVVGLEVLYEEHLKGTAGTIYTVTDAYGIEVENGWERRQEPVPGEDLVISLDYNIQTYAQQLAWQAYLSKEAESVSILVMSPQNGEIYAMVNVPEYDLNHPFALTDAQQMLAAEGVSPQELWNQNWRNGCINDTYEPGSIFKIVTAAAALEEGVLQQTDRFYCPGYIRVSDRRIRCARVQGHGSQSLTEAVMNSCNPAFIQIGMRLGASAYYAYLERFGLLEKTGIDLPGEAGIILHQEDQVGPLELATMSFGQSFQLTQIRLATTLCSLLNGGHKVIPHFAVRRQTREGAPLYTYSYAQTDGAEISNGAEAANRIEIANGAEAANRTETANIEAEDTIISDETTDFLREALYAVVEEGGGSKGQVAGYDVGGKTATSQTLPRNNGVYIASFMAFAPVDQPQVLVLAVIDHPQGTYYGGQICAPLVGQLLENILPYMEISPSVTN